MVAASKMRKAQQAALDGAPVRAAAEPHSARWPTTRAIDFTHPLLEEREVEEARVILISTDKGLCGALNTNLFRARGDSSIRSTTVFITAGRKARAVRRAHAARSSSPSFRTATRRAFPKRGRSRSSGTRPVPERRGGQGASRRHSLRQHADAGADAVEFLPVGDIKGLHGFRRRSDEAALAADTTEFLFEPERRRRPQLPAAALSQHLQSIQCCSNAKASEHSARMVAMKNATDNAEAADQGPDARIQQAAPGDTSPRNCSKSPARQMRDELGRHRFV